MDQWVKGSGVILCAHEGTVYKMGILKNGKPFISIHNEKGIAIATLDRQTAMAIDDTFRQLSHPVAIEFLIECVKRMKATHIKKSV